LDFRLFSDVFKDDANFFTVLGADPKVDVPKRP
jgi:hypothetical protein